MKLALLALYLVACADDGGEAGPYRCMSGGGGGCFELPTDPIAVAETDGTLGTPFLACSPYDVVHSAGPQSFTGATIYTRTGERAKDVHVEVFGDLALTALLGETDSDDAGAFVLDTPGAPNLVFSRATKDGYLPHAHLHQRVQLASANLELTTATRAEVSEKLTSIGDQFLPNFSQLAATTVDCTNRPLVNVIANLAPASGKNGSRLFVPGMRVYYASSGDAPALQRRTLLMQTTASGELAVANIPVGHYFLQLWGFPTENDLLLGSPGLKLLDEVELIVPSTETSFVVPLHGRL